MLLKEQAASKPNERLRILAIAHGCKMNGHPVAKRVVAEYLPQPRNLPWAHLEGVRARRDVLFGGGHSREVADRRANVEKGRRPKALEQVAQDQGGRLLVERWLDASARRDRPCDRQMAWNAQRISTLLQQERHLRIAQMGADFRL